MRQNIKIDDYTSTCVQINQVLQIYIKNRTNKSGLRNIRQDAYRHINQVLETSHDAYKLITFYKYALRFAQIHQILQILIKMHANTLRFTNIHRQAYK